MKSYSIALRWGLLSLFVITVVESNAMPLTMRRHSFGRPSLLPSHTFRHAVMSSRMLPLLPRNHESQYRGYDPKYDREGYENEEGNRDNRQEHQQEDSFDDEEELENTGTPRAHHHSSSQTGDWDERTSGTRGGFREGLEDERFVPYSKGSPGDSEVDRSRYGSPYAPANDETSPEHNHPISGSTQDTSESDEIPDFPQSLPTDDQSHEGGPTTHQGQEPPPEETEPVASPSSTNEDASSTICSTLLQLYQRLDGPAWYNQAGWTDTTTPPRIHTRDHDAPREIQHPLKTDGQMEEGTIDGQDEGQGDDDSIDRGTTSDRNDGPIEVKENNSGPSCCSWFGVTCRSSMVVGLALAGNGLDGQYPTDLVQSMVGLETV